MAEKKASKTKETAEIGCQTEVSLQERQPVSWHCIIGGSQAVVDAEQEQIEGEVSMLDRNQGRR